ncbi:MAG: SGNH/GDSL hydrolase family protein [Cellulosilyticum sp.]|nr:SGNH/GDSL hydrolase family protein [Cellulosilyticum sp.]
MELKDYTLEEIQEIKVLGRTTKNREPLTLFWTGSGIECNIKASELWVEVEVDYEEYEPWVSVVVNGAYISRQMLDKGRKWICLFRGMTQDKVKNIKFLKEVQAMSADDKHCLQIHAVRTDGTFLPVEEKAYKLEFIGDSITSGEGSMGVILEEDWISMWFSTQNNYARMTADSLGAEYRILSQSGWGVYTSWDNNPKAALPLYYEKICGVIKGEKNKALGANEPNDFNAWQPDVVIINLGTNDGGAFHSPEWKDPSTGKLYKQRLNEDGIFNEEDLTHFKEAVIEFLTQLRKYNPKAQLLWIYGMLGRPMLDAIQESIDQYKIQEEDEKVAFLLLPDTNSETVGARQHPGVRAHQAAASVLIEWFERYLI